MDKRYARLIGSDFFRHTRKIPTMNFYIVWRSALKKLITRSVLKKTYYKDYPRAKLSSTREKEGTTKAQVQKLPTR
ncbi:MAG: hypothetical protein CMM35_03470 [Rhodospirillaceae bacterium]|jgi:hypothetical protein|nr:hypothetical protein [Rhodospirillaceae bacterium]